MMNIVYFEGVKAKVRNINFKSLTVALAAFAVLTFAGCGGPEGNKTTGGDAPDATAATVNGKAIKLEEVERAIKAQGQGQEAKLSPLELAAFRIQALQNLIQQEVLFQKAEAEKTVPTEDEVNQEFSKLKAGSGVSAEEFEKRMKDAGETEATVKDGIKKQLAINKLVEKITSKVEPPKDSEIEAYYKGNPEAFVKKRGVKLAAIIVDPAKTDENDKTTNDAEALAEAKAILQQIQSGADFATVAREKSEDQSKIQGGDLGYLTEDILARNFGPQFGAVLMDPRLQIGQIQATKGQQDGRYYILKVQERSEKDENLTLEGAGVKQQVIDLLTKNRKDILSSSYASIAMNDAKIVNYLAKKIVDNPNELTGARPAITETPNANANANANTAAANTNANANSKPANANTAAKPADTKPANTAANAPANKPANTNAK